MYDVVNTPLVMIKCKYNFFELFTVIWKIIVSGIQFYYLNR